MQGGKGYLAVLSFLLSTVGCASTLLSDNPTYTLDCRCDGNVAGARTSPKHGGDGRALSSKAIQGLVRLDPLVRKNQ